MNSSACKLKNEQQIIIKPDSMDYKKNLELSKGKSVNLKGNHYYYKGYDKISISEQKNIANNPEFIPAFQYQKPHEYKERLYQHWPSKNRIYCKGYLMTGPQSNQIHNLFTWFMIISISTCFFALAGPYLWEYIHFMYVIVIIYLFLNTIFFLAATQFCDPGIIPRKEIQQLIGRIDEKEPMSPKSDDNSKKKKKFSKQKQKICPTCKIIRKKRVSHCKECDNCVERFDHHCPFVSNCIGKRNYRYFLAFLISLLLLGLGELGGLLLLVIGNFGEGVDNQKNEILIKNSTLLVIILCLLGIPTIVFTFGVCILSCLHCFLVYKYQIQQTHILEAKPQKNNSKTKNRNQMPYLQTYADHNLHCLIQGSLQNDF